MDSDCLGLNPGSSTNKSCDLRHTSLNLSPQLYKQAGLLQHQLSGLKETILAKHLASCRAHSKQSINVSYHAIIIIITIIDISQTF